MIPNENIRRQIAGFSSAIEPLTATYVDDTLTYLAIKGPDGFTIIHAYVHLNTQLIPTLLPEFRSDTVRAGQYHLAELQLSLTQLIECMCAGKVSTPGGDLLFPANDGSSYAVTHQPFHPVGLQNQSRMNTLQIIGADSRLYVHQDHLSWELRAAETPFDGLQDLLSEYRLGQLSDANTVEIVAFTAAFVDVTSSVDGEVATLKLRLATGATADQAIASYRLLNQGRVLKRSQFLGYELEWTDKGDYQLGVIQFPVTKATVVHATAIYNGLAQHHYFFGDTKTFQNPRRAAFETLDPKLDLIADILEKTKGRTPEARNFEAAVPWLFWMLGFNPAHFGGTPRTQDAADCLVCTPSGHFAVVECTIGLLEGGHKLQHLHERAVAVRRNFETSNIRHLRVLPIIVTSKTTEEIRADIENAEKLGIFIMAREQLDEMVQRSLLTVNPDQLYEEAEQVVRAALERHANQAGLSINDAGKA